MTAGPPRLPWDEPLGATPAAGVEGACTFRVWAHEAETVALELRGESVPLEPMGLGVWATEAPARHGDRYRFVVDGTPWPDPYSHWQPDGLRGPSAVVDPATFRWSDDGFVPVPLADSVLYELHVGTFSDAGTFDSAIAHLPALADLGITAIELLPIGEFPGNWGWGYDGVYAGAAQSSYGGPEGLARLVDSAHSLGLAVLVDVVYNHVGAEGGEGLAAFGPYNTDTYRTGWGGAMNYDGAWSDPVREWALQSATWWLRDLHCDGLRIDAVHAIFDQGPTHLVAELATRAHAVRPGALVVAESGLNDPKVLRPAVDGGYGCDAAWADDFHHALRTLLTGDRSGWYEEFGSVADLAKAFHRPHVHDGTWSSFRHRRFGAPADDRPAEQFVVFGQDHDQVGNRAFGDRPPAETRALSALCVLFAPFTPMLFQGEEYGEAAPFQYFTDHVDPDIAEATRTGRRREFARFASFGEEDVPDPQDEATFLRSKLTREVDPPIAAVYRAAIALRAALPPGDATVSFDEDQRWLSVQRGPATLVANFATEPREVPLTVPATELLLATHPDGTSLTDARIHLPALAGAVVR